MSVVGNWVREAAPSPRTGVHVHHGADRLAIAHRRWPGHLVLTTYGWRGDAARSRQLTWDLVAADEAQAIKNRPPPGPGGARPARPARVALTGTPVENRLVDLWALLEWAKPGLLGSAQTFKTRYAEPVERRGDEAAAERLRRLTGPFVLRRVKTDKSMISDLPEKLEMEVVCNLTAEQASLYQAVVSDMMGADRAERRHRAAGTGARHHDQAQTGLQPPGPTAARRFTAGRAVRQAGPARGDLRRDRGRGRQGAVLLDEKISLVGVDADGWLGDLLSGQADHRLRPMPTPAGFSGELRPYQQRGLSWLSFLGELGLGGILADDMGLGKTIQLLSLVSAQSSGSEQAAGSDGRGPTLLVCPMSLVGNWQREAARFTPDLRVHVHHGADRLDGDSLAEALAGADLVITTYGVATRDQAALGQVNWARVVCDEAQNIKNHATKRPGRSARCPPRPGSR